MLGVDIKFYLDNDNKKTIELINADFRILNFKLHSDLENGHRCWKMTGIFNRNNKNMINQI
jgi:hypothetical protein